MNKFFKIYDEFEYDIIRKFNEQEFYRRFHRFSKKEFTYYLLQLGYLSLEFVKFLERAKLPLKKEGGKEAIREILRDEIPASGPTHQDNRFTDLIESGLTREKILNTLPTKQTKKIIRKYYELIKYPQDNYDLRALIISRVIGEVLVGETYKHVVKGLQKHYGLKPEKSLFYTFHWQHDQKGGKGDKIDSGHTEYYDNVLKELIRDKKSLYIAKESALTAYKVRCKFHEQFIKNHHL